MNEMLQNKKSSSGASDSYSQEEGIRARAYELYLERGMHDGHDLEDWLRAEEEVTTGGAAAIAA